MRTDTNAFKKSFYLGGMSKTTKKGTQAPGASIPTQQQLEANIEADLGKCVAFLNWLRSTPQAKAYLAEFALGQIENAQNAKEAKKQNERA